MLDGAARGRYRNHDCARERAFQVQDRLPLIETGRVHEHDDSQRKKDRQGGQMESRELGVGKPVKKRGRAACCNNPGFQCPKKEPRRCVLSKNLTHTHPQPLFTLSS